MRLIVIKTGLLIPYFSVGFSLNVFVASDVFVDQRRVRKDIGMLRGKSMLGARIGGNCEKRSSDVMAWKLVIEEKCKSLGTTNFLGSEIRF